MNAMSGRDIVAEREGTGGWAQGWPLALGLALLAWLWLGPLPEMSRRAFSPHMILHLGVAVVAAPLIVWGLKNLGFLGRDLTHPFLLATAASLFELVVVWGWHAPAPHEAAAFRDPIFVLQQASFLAAGLAVWGIGFAGRGKASQGIGAMAMLMTFSHMAMLGLLISLAPQLLYAPEICQGAFGLGQLDDQRFGGALMAVGGGTPYLLGGIVLAYKLISD